MTEWLKGAMTRYSPLFFFIFPYYIYFLNMTVRFSGMLGHESPPNLNNLAKWHLKRIVLISRHETWQTVLARWP